VAKKKLKKVPDFCGWIAVEVEEAEDILRVAEENLRLAEAEADVAEERGRKLAAAEAAEYIAGVLGPETWVQGALESNGAYCAMGHIERVDQGLEEELSVAMEEVLDGSTIAGWNDAPKRTWQQVRAGFLKAAKLLKKQARELTA